MDGSPLGTGNDLSQKNAGLTPASSQEWKKGPRDVARTYCSTVTKILTD